MGFSQYQYGNIHDCWIENGYVCHETACSHSVYKYPTPLEVNIPRQKNIFMSFTVAFLLYHEDKMYVGRYDGWISIYRMSDNMLVGLNSWRAPSPPLTILIGLFSSHYGIKEVYLDTRDRVTVYTKWHRAEAKLTRPYAGDYTDIFDIEALAPAKSLGDWVFYTERGEQIGVDVWSIQDALWKYDCRVFL